jgi:hypothetical protein
MGNNVESFATHPKTRDCGGTQVLCSTRGGVGGLAWSSEMKDEGVKADMFQLSTPIYISSVDTRSTVGPRWPCYNNELDDKNLLGIMRPPSVAHDG